MKHDLESTHCVCTEDVDEYRRAISNYIKPTDRCVELGCAEGITTIHIAKYAREAIGVDKSPGQVARARARHPHVKFICADAMDAGAVYKELAQLQAGQDVQGSVDVFFVDVSGNRDVAAVVKILDSYGKVFRPRLFIAKSFKLKRLLVNCTVFAPPKALSADVQSHPLDIDISEDS